MNEREKFLFDLQGFLVIKNVLTPEEVCKLNISVDKNLDKEALRVVNSLPRFNPGMQRGKNVNVRYTIPINFTLN